MIQDVEIGISQQLTKMNNQKIKVKFYKFLSHELRFNYFVENVFFLKPYNNADSKIIVMTSASVINDKHT